MPLHDWTPVPDSVFHNFHVGWMWTLAGHLNRGVLPEGFFARTEESIGVFEPDVLVTEDATIEAPDRGAGGVQGRRQPTLTIAPSPRPVRKARRIAVFAGDRRRVAVVEIVSRGNKDSARRKAEFQAKLASYVDNRLHVGLVDFWPRAGQAGGFVQALARELGCRVDAPRHERYAASFETALESGEVNVYLEPLEIGRDLPPIPLFLEPGWSVDLPLEQTYSETFEELPAQDRQLLERPTTP